MKKLQLAVLAMGACVMTMAQTNFGIKAGYNSSTVQVRNASDWDSKSGFHLGGLAHIHVAPKFAVQPEIVFSTQGGARSNSELKLNYINVPVLAQYMVADGFRLQTGPQFGFLVSAEQKVGNVTFDIDDVYDAFDLSWAFGAGYLFSNGLGVDARYNLGLTNISDDSDFEAKNRVFQVGLFYQFRNKAGKRK